MVSCPVPCWDADETFQRYWHCSEGTILSIDRAHVLFTLLRQSVHVPGDVWECGVYKGGTARMMALYLQDAAPGKTLRLFDTYRGASGADPSKDSHNDGDFGDTDEAEVLARIGSRNAKSYRGDVRETVKDAPGKVALLHLDLDLYGPTKAVLEDVWPRLSPGGFVVADDYGFSGCPGAKEAVDGFFAGKEAVPVPLGTGQAVVFKGSPWL